MTDYRRDEDITYTKPQTEKVPDDIKAIQLICQKKYKEAIKLLVELC